MQHLNTLRHIHNRLASIGQRLVRIAFVKRLALYRNEARAWTLKGHAQLPRSSLCRYYRRWCRDLDPNRSPVDDGQPWLTYGAIDKLSRIVHRRSRVFEWGSGGSTLFCLNLGASVVSVEHDQEWYRKVSNTVAFNALADWKGHLIPASVRPPEIELEPDECNSYTSSDERYSEQWFKDYVSAIDQYPDDFFDVIFIDGRARPSCLKHAIRKVGVGGWIVFDNTDRREYHDSIQRLASAFRRLDYPGPIPYLSSFVQTTLLQRRS